MLVERIGRAHAFQRSGRIIRNMVLSIVESHFHVTSDVGEKQFVWSDEVSCSSWSAFRTPERDVDVRQIDDIAPEELRAVALTCSSEDRAREISRRFGRRPLSRGARQLTVRAQE